MNQGQQPVRAFTCVVEGDVDAAVARHVVRFAGADVARIVVKGGKDGLLKNLQGYAQAARYGDWLVLVDLDRDAECAPVAIASWRAPAPARMCLRIAVRAVEAWLLSDLDEIGRFLAVNTRAIPTAPECADDPKRLLVDIARKSRRRAIREGVVPRDGSGRAVGPAYTSLLIEFIERHWSAERALERSDSLRRCVDRVRELALSPPADS